ncbi:MAG TPA: peptidase M50, partial [Chloroflexi bacterium]|nr:peptidase M50 [Chloroflexota bacterium]
MTATVTTVSVFLAVLTVLVIAHELGHFVVARVAGIRVLEFGFGYPPRVLSITRG